MANTKNLTRAERKQNKRTTRKQLKATYAKLTPDDRRAIRKAEEPIGMKHYLAEKAKKGAEG